MARIGLFTALSLTSCTGAAALEAAGCPANVTISQNVDFGSTTRVGKYPKGLPTASYTDCCAVCAQTSDCIGWVWEPKEGTCYPVATYEGRVANNDRVLGVAPTPTPTPTPPPVPPPAEWEAAIAAGDMLYSGSGDSYLPSNKLPMIGNGFLATQLMSNAVYCAGIFNGQGLETGSHRARIPGTAAVPAPGAPGPAALDVRAATYYRRSVVDASANCTAGSNTSCANAAGAVTVEQRWYAHRALPSVMVMEVHVIEAHSAPPAGAPGAPYAMLRLDNTGGAPSADFNFSAPPPGVVPPGAPYSAVAGWTQGTECPPGACGAVVTSLFGVAVLATALPPGGMLAVPAAAPYATAYFLTVVRTTIETAGGGDEAVLVAAAQGDFAAATAQAEAGTLHASHVAEWAATVWPAGFDTDRRDLAAAVNSSLYSIVSSLRAGCPFSTSPGGLANDGYNGHSFWDAETWMFPGLLLTHPDLAASMLEYRVRTLPGARFKATTYAPPFAGAMFSWESAVSGTELAAAPWGARELHISSDIAAAVWAFWVATQDNSGGWLNATAWPLLEGIAQFWMSKIALDNPGAPAGTALSLLDVMGPDEYHDHVNNSAYTNALASQALSHAAAVAQLLGQDPALYAPWTDAALRLVIAYDAGRDYHPEFDGYALGDRVKQADTVLLGFPFEFAHATMTPSSRANDLNAYANVTDAGGPAMTWGMFAVGYIELGAGYEALAAANFNRSFANAQPPFDVWTETPSGGTPNFLTGAGGFLQTAFNGYTGLRVNSSGAYLNGPALPEGASTLGLRGLAYLGQRLDVRYDAATITVTLQQPQEASALESAAAAAYGRPYTHPCDLAAPSPSGDATDRAACRAACLAPTASSAAKMSAGLSPLRPLSSRSQHGRIVLAGGAHVVAPQPLALVDASGARHPLAAGVPLALPLQAVRIVAAAA